MGMLDLQQTYLRIGPDRTKILSGSDQNSGSDRIGPKFRIGPDRTGSDQNWFGPIRPDPENLMSTIVRIGPKWLPEIVSPIVRIGPK